MKKTLLAICMAFAATASLAAAETSYSITFKNGANNTGTAFTDATAIADITDPVSSELSSVKESNKCSLGLYGLKVGENKNPGSVTFNVAADAQVTPTKIVVKVSANKNPQNLIFKLNDVQSEALASTNTNDAYAECTFTDFTEPLTTLKIERATSTGTSSSYQGFIYVKSVEVFYESSGTEITVAAPAFELVEGQYGGYAVKMTTATEGAEIRYTMTDWEGNAPADPTAESTLYTKPVEVWGKTEFKAIAIKDGQSSRVATFEANPPMMLESFGDLLGIDAEWAGTKIEISNVTVLAQHGRYLLLSSGYNNMMVFGTIDKTFNPGDVISKLSATIAFYGETVQLTNPEFGTVTEGDAPVVKEGFVDQVAANNMYSYFTIKNATIAAVDDKGNFTLTTEDGEVALRNNFYNTSYDDYIEIPEGTGFSVTGYVFRYFETLQFCPMEAPVGGVVEEQTATPVITPEAGELNEGDFITITCETEGAKIYYTTDDTTPTVESTLYTEPIEFTGDAMTITAIAIAEGMVESKPAQAIFTKKIIVPVEGNTATFNFTAPATLDPAQTEPTSTANGVVVNDVVFKNNGITFSASKGTSTDARLWLNKETVELRVYKGATLTITSQDGYAIEKIEFEGTSNVSAIQYKENAISDNGTKGTWETTEDIQEVEFDVVGANPYLTLVTVTFRDMSGVSDVELDANAPVEFYNLQGVRMNGDLTPGLYIRRQGNKATKVLVK